MGFIPRRWVVIKYLVGYLSCLFGFALFYYYCLPDQFYHSTIKFEPDAHSRAEELRQSFQEIFRTTLMVGSCSDNWQIERDRLSLTRITVEGDEVLLPMEFIATRHGLSYFLRPIARLSLAAEASVDHVKAGGRAVSREVRAITMENFVVVPVLATPQSQIAFERCLFPYDYDGLPDDLVLASFSRKDFDRLKDYAAAIGGSPSGLPGHFWRMFYLSTSTITTTGFGDIVPLTRSARIAVSVEAIVGLIIMGLFINEISRGQ